MKRSRTYMLRAVIALCVGTGFLFASAEAFAEPISIEKLQKRCKEKTIVMGKDDKSGYVQTGERLSGYCLGYIEGTLDVLEHQKLACPKWEQGTIDSSFLLSVVTFYLEQKPSEGIDAKVVIANAFKRAFPCEK